MNSTDITILRSARKTLAIIVNAKAQVIVRAPMRMAQKQIDDFVIRKKDWIAKSQAKVLLRQKQKASSAKQFTLGEKFLYLGKEYPLISVKSKKPIDFDGSAFLLGLGFEDYAKSLMSFWYATKAQELLESLTKKLAKEHKFKYSHIKITNAKSYLGNCNCDGRIHFAWRLMLAPIEFIEYVVVHELCHTVQLNHSKKFWNLVQSVMPDYKKRVAWKNKNLGARL